MFVAGDLTHLDGSGKAVHLRHLQVHQDDVVLLLAGGFERVASVGGEVGVKRIASERMPQHLKPHRIVFDGQHRGTLGAPDGSYLRFGRRVHVEQGQTNRKGRATARRAFDADVAFEDIAQLVCQRQA